MLPWYSLKGLYQEFESHRDIYVNRTSTAGGTLLDNWNRMVPITGGAGYKYKFVAKGSGTLRVTVL